MMMRAAAALVLLTMGLAACTERTEDALPPKVRAVVERSKETQATYAVYSWNRVQRPEGPVEEWGAEFHSGHLHRVETPRDRLIADCAARTGTGLSLTDNKRFTGPQVAMAACGVNSNKRFVGAEYLGVVQTPFGPAHRIRVADMEDVRTYDIRSDGAIVAAGIAANKVGKPEVLKAWAAEVSSSLPDPNMFDEASLARSYVPDRLKVSPNQPKGE